MRSRPPHPIHRSIFVAIRGAAVEGPKGRGLGSWAVKRDWPPPCYQSADDGNDNSSSVAGSSVEALTGSIVVAVCCCGATSLV